MLKLNLKLLFLCFKAELSFDSELSNEKFLYTCTKIYLSLYFENTFFMHKTIISLVVTNNVFC